jgi:hypothetical protein
MKELKELTLLVSNEKLKGRYVGVLRGNLMTIAVSADFFVLSRFSVGGRKMHSERSYVCR